MYSRALEPPPDEIHDFPDRIHCPPSEIHVSHGHIHCPPGEIKVIADRIHYLPRRKKAIRGSIHYLQAKFTGWRRHVNVCYRGTHERRRASYERDPGANSLLEITT